MGQKLCLTHIRHRFATRMLLAGIDALTVATWLGHADTSMLSRVYGHLTQSPDYLHEKLRQANSNPTRWRPSPRRRMREGKSLM